MDTRAKERVRDRDGRFAKRGGWRWVVYILPVAFILLGIGYALIEAIYWHDKHEIIITEPVTVKFNKPITVRDRVTEIIRPVVVYDVEVDTPVEAMICEVFGQWECKTALAVAMAESGMNEQAYNANTNGSIDVGLFQINSVHFDKPGCSLAEVVEAEANTRCAKQIHEEQGWSPWVVVQTGAVSEYL